MSKTDFLTLNGVDKRFAVKDSELSVLENISLNIRQGEFISIVGGSGCGKSTLLRLLVGLEEASAGSLLLDGAPIRGTDPERGIVFQDHRLYPWLNVEDNVLLALANSPLSKAERLDSVHRHLELVGLQHFAKAYPTQLSGGMSQRVAIARGLVNRPKILLLDEPFSALDALTRTQLQEELARIWLAEGITTVLVTHDVDEAVFLGDRVVVMEPRPGRIKRIVEVGLAHPRSRDDHRLDDLRNDILQDFSHHQASSLLHPQLEPRAFRSYALT
ncbi:ABC transporter ATP-binding protein [Stutzerimonas stutzeri]